MGVAKRKRKIEIDIYAEWDNKGLNYPIAPICIDNVYWCHNSSSAISCLAGLLTKEMSEILEKENKLA